MAQGGSCGGPQVLEGDVGATVGERVHFGRQHQRLASANPGAVPQVALRRRRRVRRVRLGGAHDPRGVTEERLDGWEEWVVTTLQPDLGWRLSDVWSNVAVVAQTPQRGYGLGGKNAETLVVEEGSRIRLTPVKNSS